MGAGYCKIIAIAGFLCLFLSSCLVIYVGRYDHVCLCLVMYGHIWSYMVMVMHAAWLSMAMYGHV